MRQKVLKLA